MATHDRTETATLAGGCFWCLEAVYVDVHGVERVESGYMGGTVANPTYRQVCSGETGHAEVTRITFRPDEVSYRDLLEVFFTIHDPTTLNRQGGDVGTQYRSAIFYHSPEQRETAERVIDEMSSAGVWNDPIVTQVTPVEEFYEAEDHHHDYFARNPTQPYCQVVIAPKVAEFRRRHFARLRR